MHPSNARVRPLYAFILRVSKDDTRGAYEERPMSLASMGDRPVSPSWTCATALDSRVANEMDSRDAEDSPPTLRKRQRAPSRWRCAWTMVESINRLQMWWESLVVRESASTEANSCVEASRSAGDEDEAKCGRTQVLSTRGRWDPMEAPRWRTHIATARNRGSMSTPSWPSLWCGASPSSAAPRVVAEDHRRSISPRSALKHRIIEALPEEYTSVYCEAAWQSNPATRAALATTWSTSALRVRMRWMCSGHARGLAGGARNTSRSWSCDAKQTVSASKETPQKRTSTSPCLVKASTFAFHDLQRREYVDWGVSRDFRRFFLEDWWSAATKDRSSDEDEAMEVRDKNRWRRMSSSVVERLAETDRSSSWSNTFWKTESGPAWWERSLMQGEEEGGSRW